MAVGMLMRMMVDMPMRVTALMQTVAVGFPVPLCVRVFVVVR